MSSEWRVIFSGAWRHQENILRPEGRAMVSGIRHKLRSRRSLGGRHLFLVDNLSLALACTKGRGERPFGKQDLQAVVCTCIGRQHSLFLSDGSRLKGIVLISLLVLLCCPRYRKHSLQRPSPSHRDGVGGEGFAADDGCRSTEPGVQKTSPAAPAQTMEATAATPAGAPSVLEVNEERKVVTQERYRRLVGAFLQWCSVYLIMTSDWDTLLPAYLNELFAQGQDVSAAEYMYAAFRFRFPEYGKNGGNWLPRKMRLPTPRVAFAAIVGAQYCRRWLSPTVGLACSPRRTCRTAATANGPAGAPCWDELLGRDSRALGWRIKQPKQNQCVRREHSPQSSGGLHPPGLGSLDEAAPSGDLLVPCSQLNTEFKSVC